jgi:hypothetical protein
MSGRILADIAWYANALGAALALAAISIALGVTGADCPRRDDGKSWN